MENIIGNRFFESNPDKAETSRQKLSNFIENSLGAGASGVIVAVNTATDRANALELSQTYDRRKVHFIPVQPWGAFVTPLNSIILEAKNMCEAENLEPANTNLIFASTEIQIQTPRGNALDLFENYMTRGDVLCVGAAFPEHDFKVGYHQNATGAQIPWNTLACYDLRERIINGYDPIGDGIPGNPATKGVEELTSLFKAQTLINLLVNKRRGSQEINSLVRATQLIENSKNKQQNIA